MKRVLLLMIIISFSSLAFAENQGEKNQSIHVRGGTNGVVVEYTYTNYFIAGGLDGMRGILSPVFYVGYTLKPASDLTNGLYGIAKLGIIDNSFSSGDGVFGLMALGGYNFQFGDNNEYSFLLGVGLGVAFYDSGPNLALGFESGIGYHF